MTTLEKVQFIQENSGLLSQVPDDYLLYFNQLKEGTDDFRDLAPDVVEIVKDGADKLYTKMAELAKPKTKPKQKRQTVGEKHSEKLRTMLKNNPRIVMPKAKAKRQTVGEKLRTMLKNNPRVIVMPKAPKIDLTNYGKPQFKEGDFVTLRVKSTQQPQYNDVTSKVVGVDSRRDIFSMILEHPKKRQKKFAFIQDHLKLSTEAAFKKDELSFLPTPKVRPEKPQPEAKFKVGDDLLHIGATPYKVNITKVTWIESRKTYMYSYTTNGGIGSDDEKEFKTIPAKRKTTATPKAKPESNTGNGNPQKAKGKVKPEPPKFTGTMVRRETEEHRVVRRFLGNRKHPEMNLIVSAYKELVKSILEGKLRKEGAKNPELLYAIQKSYLNVIEKKANSLDLKANLLDDAHKVFDSERRYDTVKYLSEYTGWTGKEKSEAQVKLFVTKVGNAMKTTKETDPYFEELKQVYDRLKTSKVGQIIMPTHVGLSGISKGFRIVK